jgi:hypothetical protein
MNDTSPYHPGIMRIRRVLIPHRRWLSLLALPILLVPLVDSLTGWHLFGYVGKQVVGIALLLGLAYFVLVVPDRTELDALRKRKKRGSI